MADFATLGDWSRDPHLGPALPKVKRRRGPGGLCRRAHLTATAGLWRSADLSNAAPNRGRYPHCSGTRAQSSHRRCTHRCGTSAACRNRYAAQLQLGAGPGRVPVPCRQRRRHRGLLTPSQHDLFDGRQPHGTQPFEFGASLSHDRRAGITFVGALRHSGASPEDKVSRTMDNPKPPLLLVTDRRQARRPLQDIVAAALNAGCRWVSVREKDLPRGRANFAGALAVADRRMRTARS